MEGSDALGVAPLLFYAKSILLQTKLIGFNIWEFCRKIALYILLTAIYCLLNFSVIDKMPNFADENDKLIEYEKRIISNRTIAPDNNISVGTETMDTTGVSGLCFGE